MRVPDASSSLSLLTGARPDRSSVVALQILGLEVFSLGGCSVASSRGAASEFEGRGSRAMKSGPKAMLFFLWRRLVFQILTGRSTSRQGTTLIRHRSARGRPLAAKMARSDRDSHPTLKPEILWPLLAQALSLRFELGLRGSESAASQRRVPQSR